MSQALRNGYLFSGSLGLQGQAEKQGKAVYRGKRKESTAVYGVRSVRGQATLLNLFIVTLAGNERFRGDRKPFLIYP